MSRGHAQPGTDDARLVDADAAGILGQRQALEVGVAVERFGRGEEK